MKLNYIIIYYICNDDVFIDASLILFAFEIFFSILIKIYK